MSCFLYDLLGWTIRGHSFSVKTEAGSFKKELGNVLYDVSEQGDITWTRE